MEVSRAVITAGGRGLRKYPAFDTARKALLPIVDRDGLTKPVLYIIAEEALESGIEEICVVVAPGDEEIYRQQLSQSARGFLEDHRGDPDIDRQANRLAQFESCLHFVEQAEPEGYGHAVWCARHFADDQPFLLLLGDHLYISQDPKRRCARQLLDLSKDQHCAVSAVQATREHLIRHYGTLTGKRSSNRPDAYVIEEIIEKPDLTLAELRLQVPGVRSGHYLCFFGMHVLTPAIFELLDEQVCRPDRGTEQVQLTPALNALARREKYLALETRGSRHNLGVKFGYLEAQVSLALAGVDREGVLSLLLESVARIDRRADR